MTLVKKKWKLGFWVSLFSLTALPFSAIAQSNSTTITAKESDKTPKELSLSWSVYSNETVSIDLLNNELKLVSEDKQIEVKRFKIYIYKNQQLVELIKVTGDQLTTEAIETIKHTRTKEAIAITVTEAYNTNGKPYKFPTFFFFVN